ncbi:GTP-binding protein [Acidihalobacter prosperus]|uniref:GTP-binding protein n=1 Tax=Acidihalobacter prosperus TaxID=160660 RepID=A0A1A6C181_9GAMM|nr:ATP/GTP-binding protein [Acidihalobacter prosperus]OBS08308.1 GTP-binding protein [Acidihalobacter prosperus]
MNELKFIFTGPPGAGKTTAISSISEIPPVASDVATTDDLAEIKQTTTVAMDFGEVTLPDGQILHLYGTPGQRRFRHMWEILAQGALGLIILCDNSRPDPIADMDIYLENFAQLIEQTGAVVAVNRMETPNSPTLEDYYTHLQDIGLILPVLAADPREREDMLMLLDTLITTLEYV